MTIGLVMFFWRAGYLLSAWAVPLRRWRMPAAWALAEFFTRIRRMALPSIVLLLAFVASIFAAVPALFDGDRRPPFDIGFGAAADDAGRRGSRAGCLAALAALPRADHGGRRRRRPFRDRAVRAGKGSARPFCRPHPLPVFLPLGLAIFALAMSFDASDLKRQTRRTDIAFWLHLLAAPIIVHPVLATISGGGESSTTQAALVIGIFLLLAMAPLW